MRLKKKQILNSLEYAPERKRQPKNSPIEKEYHLPNLHFWLQNVNFRGCSSEYCFGSRFHWLWCFHWCFLYQYPNQMPNFSSLPQKLEDHQGCPSFHPNEMSRFLGVRDLGLQSGVFNIKTNLQVSNPRFRTPCYEGVLDTFQFP